MVLLIVRRGLKVGCVSVIMRLLVVRMRKIRMMFRRVLFRVSEYLVGFVLLKLVEDEFVFVVVNNRVLRLWREKG